MVPSTSGGSWRLVGPFRYYVQFELIVPVFSEARIERTPELAQLSAVADYPIGAVVTSGDGTGDPAVESQDVNALDGWA